MASVGLHKGILTNIKTLAIVCHNGDSVEDLISDKIVLLTIGQETLQKATHKFV